MYANALKTKGINYFEWLICIIYRGRSNFIGLRIKEQKRQITSPSSNICLFEFVSIWKDRNMKKQSTQIENEKQFES